MCVCACACVRARAVWVAHHVMIQAIFDHVMLADLVWFPLASLTVTKRMVFGIYRNTITPDNNLRPIYLQDVQQIVKCLYIPNNTT